jgi:hypothetical protein
MTPRRFPRTLAEAWPQDHANAIEHHKRPLGERIADVIFAILLGIFGALLLVHFLSR